MTDNKALPIINRPHLRRHWPILLVTLLTLIGVSTVWHLLQQRREQNLRDIFVHESHRITTKIDERMSAYGQILRSGAGLFAASGRVERSEWAAFVEKLDLDQSYRGIQGVGFSLNIPKQKLPVHLSEMRMQGFPDYVIKPEGDRDQYTSIIYLEPFSGRNLRAFGYDMYSEATRNAAMAQARDVGDVIFSGKVKLLQETKADVQAGLLAYFPVYRRASLTQTVEQRRAALVGWVYSPYRMNDLMAPLLARELDAIRLQIFDGEEVSDAHLLYDSEQGIEVNAVAGSGFTFTQKLELSGRYWTLRYTTLPGFAATQRFSSPWVDFATLLLIGMLVLGLSGSLISTRGRAQAIAKKLTEELRVSEQRYNAIFARSRVPMLLIDPIDGQILECNSAAAHFYGHRIDELTAMKMGQINILTPDQIATEMQLAVGEQRAHFNFSHRLADGSTRDVEVHSGPIEVAGRHLLYSIVVDVTKRHQTEEAMAQQSQRMANILWGTGVGTWEWNVQTGETRFNERWADLIGYTLDELAPVSIATWMKYAHPADLAASTAALEKHFAGETEHYECESRMLHKDGQWIWVLDRGKLVSRTHDGLPEWMAGTHSDITARKAMEAEIRQLAFFDALTGLPNRRMLNDRLSQAMASSKRSGLYGALMFLDLDNFKPLNDTHGHSAGDLLLVEVAKRLCACVREVDTVARLGGDEFVVMIGELDADKAKSTEQAANVAEKIRVGLAAPYHLTLVQSGEPEKTVEHHCSASIGVVLFINHEDSQNDLMKWADAAMYQAKDAGRNGVQFYLSPDSHPQLK
ncbi:MAG: CHASE domain-containing protein [Hydrogenophaga sp.]|uniref:sensor domain-containing diguanylate cyclase n=1 Tax=Hydrogenophaga sp. TaxID=1904254 RepID=UPI00275B087D|nr:CHASE domain-containing protein [Hydrogenophaga sp.]MDP2415885.1 CHASE domain-containing protein [Hydrogenophaga sp.]MDZ4187623.1 CHASE domain-containing protein [Hydrogenophaga sp.]